MSLTMGPWAWFHPPKRRPLWGDVGPTGKQAACGSSGVLISAPQLFDLIYREETLFNVIKSVTRNGRSILLTALLALILVYLFSIVGFLFLKDDFILEVDRLPSNHSRGLGRLSRVGCGDERPAQAERLSRQPLCFSSWVLGGVLTHTNLPLSSLGQTVGGGSGLSHSGLQTVWFRLNLVLVGAARVPGLGMQSPFLVLGVQPSRGRYM